MVDLATKPGRIPRKRQTRAAPLVIQPVDEQTAGAGSCAALQTQIADRLVTLRAEFQEAVASYSVRVQGQLSQAGDLLTDESSKTSSAEGKRRARALRRVLEALNLLDLKPAKGRRRDLKAIETFATQLGDEVAQW